MRVSNKLFCAISMCRIHHATSTGITITIGELQFPRNYRFKVGGIELEIDLTNWLSLKCVARTKCNAKLRVIQGVGTSGNVPNVVRNFICADKCLLSLLANYSASKCARSRTCAILFVHFDGGWWGWGGKFFNLITHTRISRIIHIIFRLWYSYEQGHTLALCNWN